MNTICGIEAITKLPELMTIAPQGGDYAEVGVYKGGSALVISKLVPTGRTLYLFDTFEGMPKPSEKDNYHKKGDFSDTSESYIMELFKDSDTNVAIIKGLFPDTADIIKNSMFSLVHLDVDLYQSYIDGLRFFYPRMLVGGIIVFDDYGATATCLGAKEAVDEFMLDKPEKIIQGGGGSQYYMIKV